MTATGYDLAVLLKPAGEARFANVRKLMRIAEEFESREGRDLRGLLDYLAFREEAADESAAATAAEDHDGVRIMSVHRAKGLEFGVVAVPQLDRNLLGGGWAPLLTFGRGEDRRVGMQLRRLGARSINLYAHEELRDEDNERDAAEGLRLFHVAATRARERLILSGVVKEKAGEPRPSTAVVERIVDGLRGRPRGRLRDRGPRPRAAPGPRRRLRRLGDRGPRQPALARAGRRAGRAAPGAAARRAPRRAAPRPCSSAARAPCRGARSPTRRSPSTRNAATGSSSNGSSGSARRSPPPGRTASPPGPSAREERTARGRVVHSLLEWSQANGWQEPPARAARAPRGRRGARRRGRSDELRATISGWLGSELLAERIRAGAAEVRAEVPLLLEVDGSVLRGSIDLLAERDGEPPLVVDYKTDRLGGSTPAEHAAGYEIQRSIYALAVAESRGGRGGRGRLRLPRAPRGAADRDGWGRPSSRRRGRGSPRSSAGSAPASSRSRPPERRSESLCRGCPARGRVCSGP